MSDFILGCSLCGETLSNEKTLNSRYKDHDHEFYLIRCNKCKLSILVDTGEYPEADFPCSCCYDIKKRAIEKWNKLNNKKIYDLLIDK